MEKHILIDSEVDYFEDGLIAHVGLVQFLPFTVLLAVAKDVLPDLGVPVLAQLIHKFVESFAGGEESLELFV